MNDVEWSNLHVPPNPEEEGFSEQTAKWLAAHSKLAYSGFSDISEILKNHGYERVYFFRQGGANCYLTQSTLDGGRAVWVLSFRGTESDYNDILVDVTFFKRTADYSKAYRCHGGFLSSLQGFWGSWGAPDSIEKEGFEAELFGPKGISEAIQAKAGEEDLLFVTGHSLGGALASLAAYYIDRDLKPSVRGLYTFGSPRVFDSDMSTGVAESSPYPAFRFVNAADIVPRVPPALFGFRHTGDTCYLSRTGELKAKASALDRFRDVGWLRVLYFVVVFGLAMLVASGLGALIPEGHSLDWLPSGLTAFVISIVAAVVALLVFSKVVPYLPKAVARWGFLNEFTDHSIDEYLRKIP